MDKVDVQQLFFQKIKENTPAHLSFVDEVAELLNISNDSVYRRIRGEKPISFEEIQKLCSHYKLSLDQFLNLQSDTFTFRGQLKNEEENSFENWLQNIKLQFQLFNTFSTRHMSILMKDIPPFVHFHIPELAMFKCNYSVPKVAISFKAFKTLLSFLIAVSITDLRMAKRLAVWSVLN